MSAAKPAINAPIKAVIKNRRKEFEDFNISIETRCASILSLLLLIQNDIIPHNKNKAVKPAKKETRGVCGIKAATKNATIAMLHHGKYRHAQKLSSTINMIVIKNFIEKISG